MPKLKYDGKYEGFDPSFDSRCWTLVGSFIDANGHDRIHGSFSLKGLKELGIIKGDTNVG